MASIIRMASCESTMDEAKRLAHDGAEDGTTIIAEAMTAGRGQRGSTWYAPEGGLYLSRVLRDVEDPHLLTLALGNAVAEALEIAGSDPRLKWVNDVLVGDRKVAGILVEGESTADHIDFLVAGIGVNLNGDPENWPEEVGDLATTLQSDLGAEVCVEDFETVLLAQMDQWAQAVRDGRDQDIVQAWRARDHLQGRKVRIGAVEGVAHGIDDDGHLLVDGKALDTGRVQILD